MADFDKTETGRPAPAAQRPPPIPAQKARASAPRASAPAPLAKAKAFLEIRRMRLAEANRRASAWIRDHRRTALVAAALIVVGGAGTLAWAFDVLPDVALFSPQTLAEAKADARAHPTDADAQRALGHALFAAKRRSAGVAAYRAALSLDPGVGDDRMVENLVAAFGTRDQETAEAVIWKNQLRGAQERLEPLVRSRNRGVRWGAVQTLDRLKVGKLSNWETAYVLDLGSSSCDVKRRAVEKLGEIGTKRAVKALREAKAEDEKTDGWFSSPCLGDRLQDAERQILARR